MKTLLALCGSLLISACQAGVYNIDYGRPTEQRQAITFEFNVRGEIGVITAIEVRLSILHARSSDLGVSLLLNPRLFDGSGTGSNLQDTIVSTRSTGPVIGSAGTESPFAGPEWGGITYRPVAGMDQYIGQDPNHPFFLTN